MKIFLQSIFIKKKKRGFATDFQGNENVWSQKKLQKMLVLFTYYSFLGKCDSMEFYLFILQFCFYFLPTMFNVNMN